MSNCRNVLVIDDGSLAVAVERAQRITRLIEKPRMMSPRAAATVVDAAMFGIGCIEGNVRREVQKKLDAKARIA